MYYVVTSTDYGEQFLEVYGVYSDARLEKAIVFKNRCVQRFPDAEFRIVHWQNDEYFRENRKRTSELLREVEKLKEDLWALTVRGRAYAEYVERDKTEANKREKSLNRKIAALNRKNKKLSEIISLVGQKNQTQQDDTEYDTHCRFEDWENGKYDSFDFTNQRSTQIVDEY